MRHSIELILKYEINKNGVVDNSHILTTLLESSNIQDVNFVDDFSILRCDTDGACFRYVKDKDGNDFFHHEKLKCLDVCQKYINFYNLFKPEICERIADLDRNKFLDDELTFHTIECDGCGLLASQYDRAICSLLDCLLEYRISIQDIYLPLLFLVRHSLELKLKYNLYNLGDVLSDAEKDSLDHSIKNLWGIFQTHIYADIQRIPETDKIKIDSVDRYNKTEMYQKLFE